MTQSDVQLGALAGVGVLVLLSCKEDMKEEGGLLSKEKRGTMLRKKLT